MVSISRQMGEGKKFEEQEAPDGYLITSRVNSLQFRLAKMKNRRGARLRRETGAFGRVGKWWVGCVTEKGLGPQSSPLLMRQRAQNHQKRTHSQLSSHKKQQHNVAKLDGRSQYWLKGRSGKGRGRCGWSHQAARQPRSFFCFTTTLRQLADEKTEEESSTVGEAVVDIAFVAEVLADNSHLVEGNLAAGRSC